METFHNEQFLASAQKGSMEEIKRAIVQGNIDINYQDREGNTALFWAIMHNQLEIVRFLIQNDASLEVYNLQGSGPLHLAAEKMNKEIVLLLVVNQADPNLKNQSGQRPGDGITEIRTFINNLTAESKAFGVLKQNQKFKLQAIFEDIDIDGSKYIDHSKAVKFNKYIEDSITDNQAEKDAKDFIKSVALCNPERGVNIDEWYFSFSKLLVVDPPAFDKFIEDYDKQVEKKQKLRLQMQD
ncbi:unnamed protein product [Paramecium sonneborni]|uniref:Uncharacterized protein n=1 Tax=Paramecium sonneborni TaxID=65129 RepID=A0A8S1MFG8_9CILI|nr:unnamed protein product [Paramecium sonneborni]